MKYEDGTPATVEQYAKDVTAFLAWAGDPKLEERKQMGLLVMMYLSGHRGAGVFRQAPALGQGALTHERRDSIGGLACGALFVYAWRAVLPLGA